MIGDRIDPIDPIDPPDPPPGTVEPPSSPPADGGGGSGGGGSFWVSNVSRYLSAYGINVGAKNVGYTLVGAYGGNDDAAAVMKRHKLFINGSEVYVTTFGGGHAVSDTFYSWQSGGEPIIECDNSQCAWRSHAKHGSDGYSGAQDLYFKSAAIPATASTPTFSDIVSNATYVTCLFYPNTKHSTCTAQLQYKKTADSTWLNLGSSYVTNGYSQVSIARDAVGLDAGTSYQARLVLSRSTVNDASFTSAVGSFSTVQAAPDITTVAATSVGANSAVLNATVDSNAISTVVTFEWDTNSGAPYANETTSAGTFTVDGPTAASKTITGLDPTQTYYFRAKAVHAGGTVYGSELSFTTDNDPDQEARDEDMLPIQTFDRKYGVATSIHFVVPTPSGTSSNSFYTGAAVWAAAGESKISKSGAAFADTTNDPAQVEGALYKLDLTAAELQTEEAFIVLSDAGGAVRDIFLRVRTHMQLGTVDIDAATGAKANSSALTVTGYGSGSGLKAVAGATGKDIKGILGDHVLRQGLCAAGAGGTNIIFAAGASSTSSFYVGQIVVNLTSGQARIITAYDGGTLTATVHKTWGTNPAENDVYYIVPGADVWEVTQAELASTPTAGDTLAKKVQYLFQRWNFRRNQTAVQFQMFKADNTTSLDTAVVSDNGSTQEFGRMEP